MHFIISVYLVEIVTHCRLVVKHILTTVEPGFQRLALLSGLEAYFFQCIHTAPGQITPQSPSPIHMLRRENSL